MLPLLLNPNHNNTFSSSSSSSSSKTNCFINMPKKLQKSLHHYLSKLKNHTTPRVHLPSSKKLLLSACKHPKTPSFSINDPNHKLSRVEDNDGDFNHFHRTRGDSATLSDVDRFLFDNFRSLYINDHDDGDHHHRDFVREGMEGKKNSNDGVQGSGDDHTDEQAPSPCGVLFESPRFIDLPPDLFRSDRFFVAPRSSGSIVEDARTSLTTATSEDIGSSNISTSTTTLNDSNHHSQDDVTKKNRPLPDDTIAVIRYSPSPYEEFRRSMQEMVETRLQNAGKLDWDFMEEILFCYLNLNEKKTHKFILNAFVDVVVDLRRNPERIPARSRSFSRVARERRRRRKLRNV